MNPTQVAILLGVAVGYITFQFLWKKKAEEAFQKGVTFGLKEGFECGFPQGVVLSTRNMRTELAKIGVILDKDITIGPDARPGLYKVQAFVEVTLPGQDSVLEDMPSPDNLHQLRKDPEGYYDVKEPV